MNPWYRCPAESEEFFLRLLFPRPPKKLSIDRRGFWRRRRRRRRKNMPSKSGKQHRFMAMAASPKGRAKLKAEGVKVPPLKIAKEFVQADKGRSKSKRKK